jgi:hypothetical protein
VLWWQQACTSGLLPSAPLPQCTVLQLWASCRGRTAYLTTLLSSLTCSMPWVLPSLPCVVNTLFLIGAKFWIFCFILCTFCGVAFTS